MAFGLCAVQWTGKDAADAELQPCGPLDLKDLQASVRLRGAWQAAAAAALSVLRLL